MGHPNGRIGFYTFFWTLEEFTSVLSPFNPLEIYFGLTMMVGCIALQLQAWRDAVLVLQCLDNAAPLRNEPWAAISTPQSLS